MVAFSLPHLRLELQAHLGQTWPNGRSHRALLILAALAHDAGKPLVGQADLNQKLSFVGHELHSRLIVERWAETLKLSNDELAVLSTVVHHHMRPLHLHNAGKLSKQAKYRFWRDTRQHGVDVCLLSLADYLGTYNATLQQNDWISFVELIRGLLEAYYLEQEVLVNFTPLVNGHMVQQHFTLSPGPLIGQILEAVAEAQAVGEISTEAEALAWVEAWLVKQQDKPTPIPNDDLSD
jgi:hypothetical protein